MSGGEPWQGWAVEWRQPPTSTEVGVSGRPGTGPGVSLAAREELIEGDKEAQSGEGGHGTMGLGSVEEGGGVGIGGSLCSSTE